MLGKKEKVDLLVCWLISPFFLILAGYFFVANRAVPIPMAQAVQLDAQALSIEPVRQVLGDPPMAVINNFERDCLDCHQIFETGQINVTQPNHHENIHMNHGLNVLCMNCHDQEDRNRLVLDGGKTIPYGAVVSLCAQCHGPTYRDWQKGMHGKVMGYWDNTAGDPQKLGCTACHDPHAPAFDKYVPLPGPNTLRMGTPIHSITNESGKTNPLRIWSLPSDREDRVGTPEHSSLQESH